MKSSQCDIESYRCNQLSWFSSLRRYFAQSVSGISTVIGVHVVPDTVEFYRGRGLRMLQRFISTRANALIS